MSVAYNFALEHSGDWRVLRDYFYEACKCTHFWTGPMSSEKGLPDAQVREHYAMSNNYNLVDLWDHRNYTSASYKTDVCIVFTFNKGATSFIWSADVLDACIRWLSRSTGDAFLDMDGGPVLGRSGGGLIRIDEAWARGWTRRDKYFVDRDLTVVMNALEREGLSYDRGALQPYYT